MMNYDDISRRLARVYELREARAIARLVLEERFGLTLADILCGKDTQLSADDHAELEKIVRRLENSEPVQYVLGQATFCGRRFHVGPGVLIPRPETEELCRWISSSLGQETVEKQGQPTHKRILDIGTGSGCIAVTLALSIAAADVVALDISADALAIARRNAVALGAAVAFAEHDILTASPTSLLEVSSVGAAERRLHGSGHLFTTIVSNPPYVCRSEAGLMEANVLRHEPHQALFVPDDDPLLFYRVIARQGRVLLVPGGCLYFEINPLCAEQLCAMLTREGFTDVQLHQDQFGKQRFVRAQLS